MPPLAQTKPWCVSVMITPFAMRTTRFASRRTTSTWRASRSWRRANSVRDRAGLDGREVDDGALGLRHDLLGDDQHVVVAQRVHVGGARQRLGDEGGQVVARHDLAETVDRDRFDPLSHRPIPGVAPGRAAGPRACRCRRSVARRARRGEHRRPTAAAVWARRLSPPKQTSMTSGGLSRSALVPRPWRSGTMATSGGSRVGQHVDDLGEGLGGDARQVDRQDEQRATHPPAMTSSRASRRPALSPVLRWRRGRAPAARARPRTSSSGVTTIVSAIPGVATAARIVASASRVTRSRRSSASSTAPSRDFAPSRVPIGITAWTCERWVTGPTRAARPDGTRRSPRTGGPRRRAGRGPRRRS